MYRIRSKHDGFRRCGVAHSKEGKMFPNNFFTEDQLDMLDSDPMISVIYIEETKPKTGPGPEIKPETLASIEETEPKTGPGPETKPEITEPKSKAKKLKSKGKQ